ncbi:MAG TPA: hypothetical protein VG838_04720 [Opitutaceae bacterium]|nr:hypothetical protein [Opitutaceae bacterium]
MRRVAAIFLLFWTCVLGPALPLAAAHEAPARCDCCPPNGCDHDCALPPAGPAVCTMEVSAQVSPAAVRRVARVVRRRDEVFAVSSGMFAAQRVLPATRSNPPPAGVPRFKAHCSFLI